MMKYKNLILFILCIFLSIISAAYVGEMYQLFTKVTPGFGGFIIPLSWYNFFDGIIVSFIFFLTFLFTAFGDSKKHWWITIALIPALLFEAAFDSRHLYFPVAIGLVGWLLGKGLRMLIEKHKL